MMTMRRLSALACGILFGLGLAISQMWDPVKVLDFLDIAGAWDASLLFVLGGAVAITVVGFHFVLRKKRPVFDAEFETTPSESIDRNLIIGSAIFGVGWGICGYCPGPGIAALAKISSVPVIFTVTFLLGSLIYRKLPALRKDS